METADHTNPIYCHEDAARAHLERLLWPHGPVCPLCGVTDSSTLLKGKSHRKGVYQCNECQKPFTVTVGTVFESSHIPLNKWVYGMHLMCASKKGISALQLQRQLGLGSYRSAWFMAMRLREAMADKSPAEPMGGPGKIVEADETYYGRVKNPSEVRTSGKPFGGSKRGRGPANKRAVIGLVERGGKARMFHVGNADKITVTAIVQANVHPASRLHTDESSLYKGSDKTFLTHETTKHSKREYARGDVHSNSVEGFFGVFKKGMTGVYQHCGEQYLARYLDEFAFRHNYRVKLGYNDQDRAVIAIKGAAGKRLTYRRIGGEQSAAA